MHSLTIKWSPLLPSDRRQQSRPRPPQSDRRGRHQSAPAPPPPLRCKPPHRRHPLPESCPRNSCAGGKSWGPVWWAGWEVKKAGAGERVART